MQRLVARLALDAGLGRAIGPHALRHGCATASIRLGTDVPTTAILMRHANIATTSIYVHVASDARAEPIAKLASLIPRSALPLASSSRSEPGAARNQTENNPNEGVQPPVDIHPVMDDIPRPEHDGRTSRKTGTTNTPSGACFSFRSSGGRPPLVEGGPCGHALLEQLLAQHLAAVHALVGQMACDGI